MRNVNHLFGMFIKNNILL